MAELVAEQLRYIVSVAVPLKQRSTELLLHATPHNRVTYWSHVSKRYAFCVRSSGLRQVCLMVAQNLFRTGVF